MFKYLKPEIIILEFKPKEEITSLSSWLDDNQLNDAGITNYVVNS